MKKIKNAILVTIGGLALVTVALTSCSTKSNPTTPAATITSFTPTTDTAGGTITITGTNFTGATAVTINGVAVTSFQVVSATSITAVVAPGTSTGLITVTTPAGAGHSATDFTFSSLTDIDGYSSSNQVYQSNLIGYLPFDGNDNEFLTSNAPALHGGTGITYVAGRIGQAASFNNYWVTYPSAAFACGSNNTGLGSNDTLENGFTLTVWTKGLPDTSTLTTLFQFSSPNIPNWPILGLQYRKAADSIFSFDGGFANVDASGPNVSYAALFTASAKDTGTWALWAMTYDTTGGRNVRYYYNGALIGSVSVASYFVSSATEPFLLIAPNYASIGAAESDVSTPGDASNAPAGYMAQGITATIDDIRVFNATLPAKKILDLYQLGSQGR
jgi:hypothetical protein